MTVIGLTGPTGAGKGRFADALVRLGAVHINTDEIYHAITGSRSSCTEELAACFGGEILFPDGSLNRRALAAKVFCGGEEQKKRQQDLNRIAHRYVREVCEEKMERARQEGARWLLLDAPLLYEAHMETLCDCVAAVVAREELREARIMERDHLSREDARRRMAAQKPTSYYRRRADYIIENNGRPEELALKAQALLLALEKRKQK